MQPTLVTDAEVFGDPETVFAMSITEGWAYLFVTRNEVLYSRSLIVGPDKTFMQAVASPDCHLPRNWLG